LTVYAQVWVEGITNYPGQGIGIDVWIGYSDTDTEPSTWTDWIPAIYNTDVGNNDEYMAVMGYNLPHGNYFYASRFKLNSGGYN